MLVWFYYKFGLSCVFLAILDMISDYSEIQVRGYVAEDVMMSDKTEAVRLQVSTLTCTYLSCAQFSSHKDIFEYIFPFFFLLRAAWNPLKASCGPLDPTLRTPVQDNQK